LSRRRADSLQWPARCQDDPLAISFAGMRISLVPQASELGPEVPSDLSVSVHWPQRQPRRDPILLAEERAALA
jgi:hypothetical protein